MKPTKILFGTIAVALSLSLVGCSPSTPDPNSTNSNEAAPTTQGGTLKIVGTDDHAQLDPVKIGLVATDSIARATSRQLIQYEASNDSAVNVVPHPDLAAEMPTISEDGLTYTFKLRENAMWDTTPARPITSKDIANGFKKICNTLEPAPLGTYFYSIVGFQEFCDGYNKTKPTVENVKKHILEDAISGVETPDDTTLIIKLTEPTSDFIYVLSLPNASPVPAEALEFAPNSPEYIDGFISSGPYTIDEYKTDQHLYLKRSLGWVKESDPLRAANVDRIEVTYGVTAENAMQQIQSGDADMLYGMNVPPTTYTTLEATGDKNLVSWPSTSTFFLWLNSITDNNKGALKDVKVRQALQYGVDKASFVQQLGGPDLAEPAIGIFGSGVVGYSSNDPYSTPSNAGDPEKVKSLLSEAGVSGLKLKLAFRSDNAIEPSMAQIIQQSLAKADIEIELVPKPSSDFYGEFMMVHENGKNGEWDLALCGWSPDWAGGAARSVYQPQFTYPPEAEYNYTDYNNDEAEKFKAEAMNATSVEAAAGSWAKVNDAVMADPPVIPLYSRKITAYHSTRTTNFLEYALGEQGDWTNIAISE